MKIVYSLTIAAAALAMCGCGAQRTPRAHADAVDAATPQKPVMKEPRARVVTLTGDYGHNVPVKVSPDGSIAWRPEPQNADPEMFLIPLASGYYLDIMGMDADTRFTRFTYDEYAALPQAPSDALLAAAIIPDALVAQVKELPLGRRFARMHPDEAAARVDDPGSIIVFKR